MIKDYAINILQKEKITERDVDDVVDIIKKIAPRDDEVAHRLEKMLWQRVLSELKTEPLAEAALTTLDVDFSRWYA